MSRTNLRLAVISVQVTALGVVQEDGTTGELPMSINFLVTNGAISFPTSFGASAAGPSQVQWLLGPPCCASHSMHEGLYCWRG